MIILILLDRQEVILNTTNEKTFNTSVIPYVAMTHITSIVIILSYILAQLWCQF